MTYRSASPATKSAKLIERLGDLANSLEINDFELKQFEREARHLLAADAAGAYEILGAVASLRGDAESVHGEHKRALNLSRESHDSLYNYAVSLGMIGDFDGAREAACKAFKKAPTDRETLMQCIEFSTMSGHLLEARQLILEHAVDHPAKDKVAAICTAIERGVLTEGAVREVLGISHEIMRSARTRLMTVDILSEDGHQGSFLFEIFVWTSPENAQKFNEELDDEILARQELTDDPGPNFMPIFLGASVDVREPE